MRWASVSGAAPASARASSASRSSSCMVANRMASGAAELAGGGSGARAGDAPEGRADGHAHAGGIALAEEVARRHLASDEEIGAGLAGEAHGSRLVGAQPEVGEGDPRAQRVAEVGRPVEGSGPVRLGGRERLGVAAV